MIKTYSEIRTDILDKGGINTTSAFYTQDMINNWIQQANRWATSYKKWVFTEGRVSTTYTTGTGENSDEWNFEGLKADSIRILKVGSDLFEKLNFEDYLIFRDEEPDSNDRVYSDFGRTVFINPNSDSSGTLTAYAQFAPVDIDVTDEESVTVFTNWEEEGNEAIVEKVLSFISNRERNKSEAQFHHDKAVQILESIKGVIDDEQYAYKTHSARGGMWKRINILGGALQDELFKRDQF